MEIGLKGQQTLSVTEEKTAEAMGSGGIRVFATPVMIALMEKTAYESVQPLLEPGFSTVGTKLEVDHVSATPVGATITCNSELIEIDRKRLVFKVEAFDDAGLIGQGIHERFIIEVDKFMSKAESKMR